VGARWKKGRRCGTGRISVVGDAEPGGGCFFAQHGQSLAGDELVPDVGKEEAIGETLG
jgi:hypothetical protein